jgi:hypothetical protein
MKLNRTLR